MKWSKLGGIIAGIFILVMATPLFLIFAIVGIFALVAYLLFGEDFIKGLSEPC
jgi:uncharacterized membrane protein YgaE (UPF0421/DUF939 family)